MIQFWDVLNFNFLATHLIFIGIFLTLTLSLNLINGVAGQFSLGHQGFWALGAYAAGAVVTGMNGSVPGHWVFCLSLAAGVLAAAAGGLIVGFPCLRLRGDYLAIGTLGFAEIIRVSLNNLERLGGSRGLRVPQQLIVRTPETAALFYCAYLAVAAVMVGLTTWICYGFVHSRHGRAALALREDEVAAAQSGIPVARYKILTFLIGASLAGLAGGVYANFFGVLSPRDFGVVAGILLVMMVVLGGRGGSMRRVALATVLLYSVQQLFKLRLLSLPTATAAVVGNEWLSRAADHVEELAVERWQLFFALFLIAIIVVPRRRPRRNKDADDKSQTQTSNDPALASASEPPKEPAAGPRAGAPSAVATGVPPDVLLRCQGLTVRFGGVVAVDGVSLDIRPGERVGLIGPNGAGKTTLFNAITGAHRPSQGEVFFRGRKITGLRPDRINAAGIARTFQNIRLFKGLNAFDNVRVGCHGRTSYGLAASLFRTAAFHADEAEIRRRSSDLLEVFGFSDRLAGASRAQEPADSMSYSGQRKLEIVRTLASNPRLLLLDEPAAGMNGGDKVKLAGLIRDLYNRHHLTLLVIEHDMGFVMGLCDRILVLEHGKIIADGTPSEVRNEAKVIQAYLGEGNYG